MTKFKKLKIIFKGNLNKKINFLKNYLIFLKNQLNMFFFNNFHFTRNYQRM